jgi:hypothetical protein
MFHVEHFFIPVSVPNRPKREICSTWNIQGGLDANLFCIVFHVEHSFTCTIIWHCFHRPSSTILARNT